MRLEPIDKPSSLRGRLMSAAMRWQLGKVITPARVFYNRVPRLWNVAWAQIMLQMRGLSIPQELFLLIQARVSQMNGCAFCHDIALARVVQDRIGLEKFENLERWREHPSFSEAERAALAYCEEATRSRVVADETFANLKKHFDDRAIVEITYANALENYYNLLNVPLEVHDDGLLERARAKQRAA